MNAGNMSNGNVAGVDLAASPRGKTGIVVLEDTKEGVVLIYHGTLKTDTEIVSTLLANRVRVVAIDAPLTASSTFRRVDLLMIKSGFRVLPPGMKGMRELTERGIYLSHKLRNLGLIVLETHPRSSLKSSMCGDVEALARRHGLDISSLCNSDELDAFIAALTALYCIKSSCRIFEEVDGKIYLLPKIC